MATSPYGLKIFEWNVKIGKTVIIYNLQIKFDQFQRLSFKI